MASLRIPNKHLSGLAKLLSMPEDTAVELTSALENAPVSFDPRQVLKTAVSGVTGISPADAASIKEALISLLLLRARSDESQTDVIDELSAAIQESDAEELQLPDEVRANAKKRLSMFLGIPSLLVSSKAVSVRLENDKLFSKARVVSDIRPIFGENVKESPKAAIILHQLGIHYFQDGDHKEFFVAMDTDEVQELISSLERAKAKAESLEAVLAAANLPHLKDK
ncbi:MAG: hypothetical protein ACR2G4_02490 [Pyrinomonadaceae bacterium]